MGGSPTDAGVLLRGAQLEAGARVRFQQFPLAANCGSGISHRCLENDERVVYEVPNHRETRILGSCDGHPACGLQKYKYQ